MNVKKAYEITDAKITFVSLVDKAANLKTFLITKADDGQATFSTYGRIVKRDASHHFVTGIVYEPMAEDAHGNFMTEDEITKAAYYFAKSGNKVDLQHSFEPLSGATVVESWIAKSDTDIEGEAVKKGTWLMTVEITDEDIWKSIENGDITGFSMGGVGVFSEDDVNIDEVEKSDNKPDEKKGLFKRLAELFGFDVVEKGAFSDKFNAELQADKFWLAMNTLQDVLYGWNSIYGCREIESDPEKISEALSEFSGVLTETLAGGEIVAKSIAAKAPVEKAGKKLSGANRDTLSKIHEELGVFLAQFDDPEDEDENQDKKENKNPDNKDDKEEDTVTKDEIQKMIDSSIQAAITKALDEKEVEKAAEPVAEPETITADDVQKMVNDAVTKAVEEVKKQRGVPSSSDGQDIQKSENVHYLHGIL